MNVNYSEEFIGREIKVIQARNKSLEGVQGRVIDDTKNTFRIITASQEEKTLLKQGAVFMINKKKIKGEDVLHTLRGRIKLRK